MGQPLVLHSVMQEKTLGRNSSERRIWLRNSERPCRGILGDFSPSTWRF